MEIFRLIWGVVGSAIFALVGIGQLMKESDRIDKRIGIGLIIIGLIYVLLTFLTLLYAQEIYEKDTINCPNCEIIVSDEDAFCSACGTPLTDGTATDPECIGCGDPIQPDANFCPNCGEPQNN